MWGMCFSYFLRNPSLTYPHVIHNLSTTFVDNFLLWFWSLVCGYVATLIRTIIKKPYFTGFSSVFVYCACIIYLYINVYHVQYINTYYRSSITLYHDPNIHTKQTLNTITCILSSILTFTDVFIAWLILYTTIITSVSKRQFRSLKRQDILC